MQLRALAKTIEAGAGEILGFPAETRLMHSQIIIQQIVEALLAGEIGYILEEFSAEILESPTISNKWLFR